MGNSPPSSRRLPTEEGATAAAISLHASSSSSRPSRPPLPPPPPVDYDHDDGIPGKYKQEFIGFALFDMETDPMESKNVIDQHRDIALELIGYANTHQQKFYAK